VRPHGDVRVDVNAEVADRGDRQHINGADPYRCGSEKAVNSDLHKTAWMNMAFRGFGC